MLTDDPGETRSASRGLHMDKTDVPSVRDSARKKAEHHVLMARSAALEALGEGPAGARLIATWVSEEAKALRLP